MTKAKSTLNAGQKFGIFVMIAAVAIPAFWWAVVLWRDVTKSYCEGECASGWYAVIGTWLAVPTLMVGALIFGISAAVRNSKNAKAR